MYTHIDTSNTQNFHPFSQLSEAAISPSWMKDDTASGFNEGFPPTKVY